MVHTTQQIIQHCVEENESKKDFIGLE